MKIFLLTMIWDQQRLVQDTTEQKVNESGFNQTNPFIPPVMSIHSANPVGRQKMQLAIQMIYQHFKVTQPIPWEEFKKSL
jgi:hypothetical protein